MTLNYQVIQEIRAEKVANITHHLTSQSLIIKSLWNEAFPDMVNNIYNFVTRYLNNTLPTLKSMLLCNKTSSNLCNACSNVQTFTYNMSCPLVRPIWTKGAIPGVTTQFLNILSSIYLAVKKDLRFYADVEGFENPSVVTGLEDRPVLIIENYANRNLVPNAFVLRRPWHRLEFYTTHFAV